MPSLFTLSTSLSSSPASFALHHHRRRPTPLLLLLAALFLSLLFGSALLSSGGAGGGGGGSGALTVEAWRAFLREQGELREQGDERGGTAVVSEAPTGAHDETSPSSAVKAVDEAENDLEAPNPWWSTSASALASSLSDLKAAAHARVEALKAELARLSPSPSSSSSLSSSSSSPPSLSSSALPEEDPDAALPDCPRTLLFRPHGTRGFASEYNRFVRTAAVASKFGYEVFVVQGGTGEGWMYGSFDDYFSPPTPLALNRTCRLPSAAGQSSYADRVHIAPRPEDLLPASSPSSSSASSSSTSSSPSASLSASDELSTAAEQQEGTEQAAEDQEPDLTNPPRYTDEALETPWWTEVDHIADAYDVPYISALFLSLHTHTPSLRTLHASELAAFPPSLPLPAEATVPTELREAFEKQAEVVRGWWQPRREVEEQVESLGEWVGGRRVVGVHLRLGDKCLELGNPKYSPLRYTSPSTLSSLIQAGVVRGRGHASTCAKDGENVLSVEEGEVYGRAVLAGLAKARAEDEEGEGKREGEVVVVMSDDPSGLDSLLAAWSASEDAAIRTLATSPSPYNLQGKGEAEEERAGVEVVSFANVAEELGLRFVVEAEDGGEEDSETALMGSGFAAREFAKARFLFLSAPLSIPPSAYFARDELLTVPSDCDPQAPLPYRIALTLPFIRDLTFLSRYSSSLVLTESSNVGRLLTLLASPAAVEQGRVISADVRWFPTAYYA
ncbi:hypothetical protein JCM10213_007955 [Rhodosporidiobolus nylandii]